MNNSGLFQLNGVIFNHILKDAFAFVAEKNLICSVMYAILLAGLIFVSGLIVEFIRQKLMRFIKISSLSKRIVDLSRSVIGKMLPLLD